MLCLLLWEHGPSRSFNSLERLSFQCFDRKLSSLRREAKLDVMSALPLCCRTFGPQALSDSLLAVWLALKAEVYSAVDAADDVGSEKAELAAAAATCLTQCIRALGAGALDQYVVADAVLTEDLPLNITPR